MCDGLGAKRATRGTDEYEIRHEVPPKDLASKLTTVV
jgi:hypothetical protein